MTLTRKTPLKPGSKPLSRGTPMKRSAVRKEAKPDKGPKPKKCANRPCRAPYLPNPGQPFKNWCSDDCAAVIALEKVAKQKAAKEKAERAEDKKKREKLKTRSDWIKEAQAAFNAFIRNRDDGMPCICCGKFASDDKLTGGGWDCGHYRSTGSAPHLRFNEDNAHRQRKVCNQHGAGRAVDYRLGLIARIGLERVEALEADQAPQKWTVEELKAIRDLYRSKLKTAKAKEKVASTVGTL